MKDVYIRSLPKTLNIRPEEFEEGITLHFKYAELKKPCQITISASDAEPVTSKDTSKDTSKPRRIPGHPNCYYGDCSHECHVVSCGIYQGYEEYPTYDECIPIDCDDDE